MEHGLLILGLRYYFIESKRFRVGTVGEDDPLIELSIRILGFDAEFWFLEGLTVAGRADADGDLDGLLALELPEHNLN